MTNTNDAEHDALLVVMAYPSELREMNRNDLIHVRKWDTTIFYFVKNIRNDVDYERGYVGVQDVDDRNRIVK